jgi:hypothetical protein
MSREKIFLTVLTYPMPSVSYEDSFCAAGFREDGSMIRLYPVPFKRYKDLHKFSIIGLDVVKRRKGDFRPESYSPKDFYLSDLSVLDRINTENNWEKRKEKCLINIYSDFDKLIEDSNAPVNKSLAVFKPKEIIGLLIENDTPDWKPAWKQSMTQFKLFDDAQKIPLEKIPFKFKYHFTDINNKSHKLQIFDWEIGVLYRKCLALAGGDKSSAIKKVKQKFFDEFLKRDIYFFLGTTLEWHLRRSRNPFVIIGVFYPPDSKKSEFPPFS